MVVTCVTERSTPNCLYNTGRADALTVDYTSSVHFPVFLSCHSPGCWRAVYICLAVMTLRCGEVTNGNDCRVNLALNLTSTRVAGGLEDRAILPLQFLSFQKAASFKTLDMMTQKM